MSTQSAEKNWRQRYRDIYYQLRREMKTKGCVHDTMISLDKPENKKLISMLIINMAMNMYWNIKGTSNGQQGMTNADIYLNKKFHKYKRNFIRFQKIDKTFRDILEALIVYYNTDAMYLLGNVTGPMLITLGNLKKHFRKHSPKHSPKHPRKQTRARPS